MRLLLALLVLRIFAFPTAAWAELPTVQPSPSGRVTDEGLPELSGLAPCHTRPGCFWAVNDSGNPPLVFAISSEGELVGPPLRVEGVANLDWEAVETDGSHLYIGDVGNNSNDRPHLSVYVLEEPVPGITGVLPVQQTLRFRFPDQASFPPGRREFDCEAMVWWHGSLWFLTKHRDSRGGVAPTTRVYRMDREGTGLVEPLTLVEEGADLGGFVTDAAVSRGGRTLAVLTLGPKQQGAGFLWLFELPPDGSSLLSGPRRGLRLQGLRQAEALAWLDEETLLVGNEQGDLFRVPLSLFPPAP